MLSLTQWASHFCQNQRTRDFAEPMNRAQLMRRYQRQAVASASPEQLVVKLYDIAIGACLQEDRTKLRRVLVELTAGLDMERGGEIAGRLYALYDFCLHESISGDINVVRDLLDGLRDAWRHVANQRMRIAA